MIMETKRLVLREYTQNDLSDLYEIMSDAISMMHYPHTFDKEETKFWIEHNIARYAENGYGLWAVVRKENNCFIGDCGITLQNINGNIVPEIGYHINKKYVNCGYATEAAKECLKYAFEVLHFDRVYSYMKYTNIASRRVAEKIGMTFDFEYDDEANVKTCVYSVSAGKYQNISD